jgi:FkbM family methyltransferase
MFCGIAASLFYMMRNGSRFVCIPASATSVHEYVNDECYEEIELRICRQWLRPGDACLDIGANIGLISASFAESVGPQGVVVAVEPAPATHRFLHQATNLLGRHRHNIRLEAICVADHSGQVPFMVATTRGSDVEASMKIEAHKLGQFAEIMVPALTVDSLIDKHRIRDSLALVKIDIEGGEPMALCGGASLFECERLPLFIIEMQRASLANFRFKPSDVLKFFPEQLFELFYVQRSRSDSTELSEHGCLYALSDQRIHALPIYSNLVIVPRSGRYADRREAIAEILGSQHSQCS